MVSAVEDKRCTVGRRLGGRDGRYSSRRRKTPHRPAAPECLAAADVPWSRVAAVLAINRLCAPGSELAIEERWYPTTALDDLLHIPEGAINDSRLYRTLDHLLPHEIALERHLTARYGELFAAEFDVLLYDLTSSYVEGTAPKNPMMRRGDSRDHRPDYLQVVLAVIVNVDDFPLSYETFDGNRADVTTLETVMRMIERKYGQARRVWVFDRGIVSDANLAAIRRRGGQYLVGTRRTTLRHVERALLEGPWTQVRDEVEAQLVPIPGGTETYVLCRSTARREKELAIRRRFSTRLEDRLRGLEHRVATGRLKDRAKIERGLGRLQASYASVADLYEMAVRDEAGQLRLHWGLIENRRAWRDAREGADHHARGAPRLSGRSAAVRDSQADHATFDAPLCRVPDYAESSWKNQTGTPCQWGSGKILEERTRHSPTACYSPLRNASS